MALLPMDADILPPTDDRIFKTMLTAPEAKPFLMKLITGIIGRTVVDVTVHNNEIPVSDTKVIASDEVLTVASDLLMNISQDERERAIFRSRRKWQMDHASDLATAEDRGRQDEAKNILEMIKHGYSLEMIERALQEKVQLSS